MNLKVKGLVLAVVSALILNGCDSDSAKEKIEAGAHHAKEVIAETGDRIDTELHREGDDIKTFSNKLTENAEKESLRQLGLDEADIDYVIEHNPDDAMAVAKHTNDEILYQTKFHFVNASGVQGGMDTFDWLSPASVTNDAKPNLQKILGRVAFVINSAKFIKMFDDNIQYLNANTFSVSSAYPNEITTVPNTYDEFKSAVKAALSREGNSYNLYAVGDFQGGDARGDVGRLSAYFKLAGIANSSLKASAPLVLHELTHTFGYEHAGSNQDAVIMKPNNVPYLVQLITMDSAMQDKYQGDMQMFSDSVNKINQMPWYAGDSMFSTYFGDD
ncbi:hypothetical protein VIN01S_27730 [Vibrio inusitatus NBRC 102082]|uniref:Uncharacterized protein n=1 Tax=Vibrio inusitatus NBRC 102082 TaxID=1219070 RepID=A0A4Y3HXR8_9VIBR|nr:hypothetical protein [Vibrio inusitatus]GEA51969.1 hypothetical protein VIN01S_27730 [Vibrio inusitatus NBRC 102082]